jgi:hypothetical protein
LLVDDMTAARMQETFGISRTDWRRLATGPGMPAPLDPKYTGGETKWSAYAFARWLAARHPDLAEHTPFLLRPAGSPATRYLGGSCAEDDFPHARFVGLWRTGFGRLAIVYPLDQAFDPDQVIEKIPSADTIVVVWNDWSIYGVPNLEAVDPARPELPYSPDWVDVAAHIGTRVPWWPLHLRRARAVNAWSPGDEPATVEPVSWPSWEPLYDMALSEAKGNAVRTACFSIGHQIRKDAAENAAWEIAHMDELAESGDPGDYVVSQQGERASMMICASPDPDDPGRAEAVEDDEAICAGVVALGRRTDDLAVECLGQIAGWTNRYSPFGGSFSIVAEKATPAGREWIARLRHTTPTALHRLEGDRSNTTDTLVDPVTDAPVIARVGHYMFSPADEVSYLSYAARRLPPGSRIKEVILDNPIWVRTEDGTLHPMPTLDAPGLSWGYRGSGPGTLAVMIGRLLDDGSADAVGYDDKNALNGEPKLEAFLQRQHERGTRLSRRLLESARVNGPDRLGLFDRVRFRAPGPS